MMTSTTEASDRSNKRPRNDETDANQGDAPPAVGGSPAAAMAKLTDLIKALETCLGPRLEKAVRSLVSQPTESQDLLISRG